MDLTENTASPALAPADSSTPQAEPTPGSVTDFLGGTPAATPAAAPAADASVAPGGDVPPDFLAMFTADTPEGETASMQDWIKASGIKDVASLAKIARDNQRALRESGRVRVPGEGATDQEIAEYRQAIGVPAKPEDYTRPEFKDADGNPIPYNAELTDRVFARMHELGVPKTAAEALMKAEIETQLAEYDTIVKQLEAQANAHVTSWGDQKDAKLEAANAAIRELGFTREEVQHMRAMPGGPGKFLDAMVKIGSNVTEDSMVRGDRRTFGMSADQAQKEIATMRADKATLDKIMVPGTAENTRYERLLAQVAAAADRQPVDI